MNYLEFLNKNGLDYKVEKKANIHEIDGVQQISTNSFFNYRTDTNQVLGDKLGKRYTIIQNTDAFKIVEDLIASQRVELQRSWVNENGNHAFVSFQYLEPIVVKVNGIDDVSYSNIVLGNSFDGKYAFRAIFTNTRIACHNQWQAIVNNKNNYIKTIKHSQSNSKKLSEINSIFAIGKKQIEESIKVIETLSKQKISDDELQKILVMLVSGKLNADDEETKQSTRGKNIIDKITNTYYNGDGQSHIIGTKWGAYNAITNYYTHGIDDTQEEKDFSLLCGNRNKKTNEGLKLLLQ